MVVVWGGANTGISEGAKSATGSPPITGEALGVGADSGAELSFVPEAGGEPPCLKTGAATGAGAELGSEGCGDTLPPGTTSGTSNFVAHFGQLPRFPEYASGTRMAAVQYGQLNSIAMGGFHSSVQ